MAKKASMPGLRDILPGGRAVALRKPQGARLPVLRSDDSSGAGGYPEKQPPPLWSNFGAALEDLPDLARQIMALNAQKKGLQEEIDSLNMAVKGLMENVDDTKSWSCRELDEPWVAMYVKPGPRSKLVKELLIQAGVTDKQLAKGTKVTPSAPYVSVRNRNEKYERGEE